MMQKIRFKLISIVLCFVIAVSFIPVSAATPSKATITGEQSSSVVTLANGVTHTSAITQSISIYNNRLFNIIEADLSDRNLYLNTVYGGSSASHAYKTGSTIVKNYASSSGKTPVAAINADLWWLYTGSATESSNSGNLLLSNSSGLAMSLGFSMSNGEIYTSDRMPEESFVTTGGISLHYEDYQSFGITSDFVPVISNPNAEVIINNNTKNTTAEANGINRLPANNTLVMYTDKGCKNNYANDDAYEVKIKINSTADYVIKHGTSISGTVTEVHSPSMSSNPTMSVDSNYIILTARGTKYNSISSYSVGDKVSIDVSVYDASGKYTKEWQRVTDAVAGHIPFVKDGITFDTIPLEANYPATIIGINNSGNVVMATVGATTVGKRLGLTQTTYDEFAKDLDLRDAFLLDGGGSSTMVVKNGSDYKIANCISNSNGTERQLLSMLVLSTGATRQEQGKIPVFVPNFDTPNDIDFTVETNAGYLTGVIYDTNMSMTPYGVKLSSVSGYDPYVYIDLEVSDNIVYANDNRYIVMEYMIPVTNSKSSYETQIFYHTGTNYSSSETCSVVNRSLIRDGEYHTAVFDMANAPNWTDKINFLRLDYFSSCSAGDTIYVRRLAINSSGIIENSNNPYIVRKNSETFSDIIAPYILNAESYEIINKNGDAVNVSDAAATYSILNVQKSGELKTYYIVIMGDCNGDSSININDVAVIYSHLTSKNKLDTIGQKAADVRTDGYINILDIMALLNNI